MAKYPKCMMAASVAIAFSLTACGGGGGGGLASTPIPTPTPTPTGASIGAPARAAVPNASLFPQAVDGGPTIAAQPKTLFPLLQSVVSISPAGVVADTATINAGATLAFDSSNSSYDIDIKNSAIGISNVTLSSTPSGVFQAFPSGAANVFLQIANPATSNLSWTTYGMWDVVTSSGSRTQAAFVTGYETPVASVPTTGTATFSGVVRGEVLLPQAGRENGVNYLALSGDASMQANFASGSITGSLTNMFATDFDGARTPWNSVSLLSTFSGSQNIFTGTTAATSAPGNSASLNGNATGTVAGKFFGPSAQELGAVWTLSDGIRAAIGTIAAKAGSPWDY